MKQFCCLICAVLIIPFSACGQSETKGKEEASRKVISKSTANAGTVRPGDLFHLTDAEKILGESARLTDSATSTNETALTYKCAYTAKMQDAKSGKMGVVYLLVEHYFELASAQKRYSFIKTANQDHGIQQLQGIGDEAYFHTDGQNFYFIMVRDGDRVFNMKVNKITQHTSLDEFNRVARQIAAEM